MKITVLAGYFTPEQSADTHLNDDLVRDLASYGAEVDVIVPFPTRGLEEEEQKKYETLKCEELAKRLRVHRIGKRGKFHSGLIRRGVDLFVKVYKLYSVAKKEKTDCYFIVSTPPFLGYAAIMLSKKAPVVYKLQDIFPDSLMKTKGWTEKNFVVRILRKLERKVYASATQIVVMSNDMKNTLMERNVPESKIQVIYDWIDVNSCLPVTREENSLFDEYGIDREKFVVSYAGNIGYLQNLETVMNAAKIVMEKKVEIQFVIIGDGAWKPQMMEMIAANKITNVCVLPMQPLERVSEVYSMPDIGLVSLKPGVSKAALPSKTWSIMSAACPVICEIDPDSELSAIIHTVNCGETVESGDAKALAEAVLSLYGLGKEKLVSIGLQGREYIVNNLDRKHSTAKYFKVIENVVQGEKCNV